MLYSLEVPPSGGDTWVLGMQAAWTTLPDALKAKVRGRRIKHDGTYNSGGYLRKGVTPTDDPHTAPGAWHPAVLRHPATGAPSLFLGRRRNSYVEGLRSGRIRRPARRALGAYRARRSALPAPLARRRSAAVGQPLNDAPARSVRQRDAPRDAPHADQGQGRAAGVGRGGLSPPQSAAPAAGADTALGHRDDFATVELLFELSTRSSQVPLASAPRLNMQIAASRSLTLVRYGRRVSACVFTFRDSPTVMCLSPSASAGSRSSRSDRQCRPRFVAAATELEPN